jgi:hypothetical protein
LAQWLRRLRRQGVQCRLLGGRVRIRGLRRLAAADRAALLACGAQVQALLEARTRRRSAKQRPPPQRPMQPEAGRTVVGQVVNPGGPLRLLYADEVQSVPLARARVLGRVPYGWKVQQSGGGE